MSRTDGFAEISKSREEDKEVDLLWSGHDRPKGCTTGQGETLGDHLPTDLRWEESLLDRGEKNAVGSGGGSTPDDRVNAVRSLPAAEPKRGSTSKAGGGEVR